MGPIPPNAVPNAPRSRGEDVSRGVWRLLVRAVALLAGTIVLVLAFVFLVPDGNDYARATVMKHARLAAGGPGKIVFVGGSNLAYGFDSAMVERALGRRAVNMGMNGYLGVRYMLEEIKPALLPSDIVVIALEYDSFYKSGDGTSSDLLMIAKANPTALTYLSWGQRWGVAQAVPYAAQQKALRLVRSVANLASGSPGNEPPPGERTSAQVVASIESFAGFNEYGDLVSHLGVPWSWEREDGLDASKIPVDRGVVSALREFALLQKAKGVTVILSYTPIIPYYYDRHRHSLETLHTLLTKENGLVAPSPPSAYVFPELWFFDTVYHLNQVGREMRTKQVIRDIERQLGDRGGKAQGATLDGSLPQGE